jgi:hypothetical protein
MAVVTFAVAAGAAQRQQLGQAAAEAGALEPLKSAVAPLVLGASLAAQTDTERATQRGRFDYVQTMLAFAAVGELAPFKSNFGALPKASAAAAPPDDLEADAAICAALRDAYFDRWRLNSPEDDARWRDLMLVGARFFANAEVGLLRQIRRDDDPGLADAEANLGAVLAGAVDPTQAVVAFEKAIAVYDAARVADAALANADEAFATQAGGAVGLAQGARPPPQYYAASALEALVPVAVAIAGVEAARGAIGAKDRNAASAAIDAVARANAQAERVNQYLQSTWPCQPQLAEIHFWRAEQDVLRWRYVAAFETAGAAEMAKAVEGADRQFVAALAIALHAAGARDESFTVKRDQYLSFLRASGQDADAAARVLDAVADSDPGEATPQAWRPILDCGAGPP